MDVTLPEETSSDDWATFHTTEGGIALSGICMFAMPEDCIGREQRWQPKGFDQFPNELQTTFTNQDFGAYNNAKFIQGTPEQQVKRYEAAGARATGASASRTFNHLPETGPTEKNSHDFTQAEHEKLAKIWGEVVAGAVTEESLALVRTRLNMVRDWTALADKVLENPEMLAIDRMQHDAQRVLQSMIEGREQVGDRYFDLITTLIHQLNILRGQQPEMINRLVHWRVRWPSLIAAHPFYRIYDDPPESLGAGYPFRMDQGSRWQPDKDHHQVALQLIVFLSRLKPALTRFAQRGGHGADQFDESLQAVMALKECPEATPECWRAAALHFQLGYPNPETDPRFQAWLTARSYKKISPKAKRRRIMEKLQHAFIGILGGHKLR